MEANIIQNWNRTTEAIYKNVLLYTIAGICAAVFGMIPLMGWLAKVFNILVVAGYTAFYLRIKDLSLLTDPNDAAAMKKLTTGVLLYILGIIIAEVKLIGWIVSPILLIIAFIFMMIAYSQLKKSETFPNRDGFKLIFVAMILGIVAGVFALIPLAGAIIAGIISIVVLILVLCGWKKVAAPVA